jgi:hypothetical protein
MRLFEQHPREPTLIWSKSIRSGQLEARSGLVQQRFGIFRHPLVGIPLIAATLLVFCVLTNTSSAREKKPAMHYGAGLIVNVPLPEPEVAQAVEDVAQNTVIRGTKEYNKDEYVTGAAEATSALGFPPWKEGGKVFYKVRKEILDPLNFKNGGDIGTLAVRYVVKPQGDKNTILRIDALFVEDFRRGLHASNGSVESSEYQNIQDHLGAVELIKKETAEALEAKQEHMEKQKLDAAQRRDTEASAVTGRETLSGESAGEGDAASAHTSAAALSGAQPASSSAPGFEQPPAYQQAGESLEQHVANLRREVERFVKKPGAPLQSAPFHTATTLKSLQPGSEVLILISTPYWYGVETHEGEHGWMRRDQLELVP